MNMLPAKLQIEVIRIFLHHRRALYNIQHSSVFKKSLNHRMYLFQHIYCESIPALLGNGSLVALPGEPTCTIRSNRNMFGWVTRSFHGRSVPEYTEGTATPG
jgi:hypothetical protein